jgi:LytS/YehU family sensor histidine kinase
LRSNNKFDYNINIGPEVDESDTFIPNMIVQPFVENSILHGMTNAKGKKGMIRLDISKDNKLTCVVDDNGEGINSINVLRQAEADGHVSMGSAITEKRIAMYNSIHEDKIELQVTDKSETGSAEPGTRVTLRFPLSN